MPKPNKRFTRYEVSEFRMTREELAEAVGTWLIAARKCKLEDVQARAFTINLSGDGTSTCKYLRQVSESAEDVGNE